MKRLSQDDMMAQLFGGVCSDGCEGSNNTSDPYGKQDAAKLQELSALYNQKHDFKVGDLVEWKPGLKNRKYPAYGTPVVVVELFDSTVRETSESTSGTPYYHEPIQGRMGIIDSRDGDFECYALDFNRLQPYAAPVVAAIPEVDLTVEAHANER